MKRKCKKRKQDQNRNNEIVDKLIKLLWPE